MAVAAASVLDAHFEKVLEYLKLHVSPSAFELMDEIILAMEARWASVEPHYDFPSFLASFIDEDVRTTIEDLRTWLDATETERDALKARVEMLEHEVNQWKGEVAEIKDAYDALRKKVGT